VVDPVIGEHRIDLVGTPGKAGAMSIQPAYDSGLDEGVLLEETIGANFERTVAAQPDREALVEVASGRRWTWSELNHDIDALARGLIAAGLTAGDRVGIWAPNCAEWVLVQYATAKLGIILVNVNPAYRTHEFAYAVNQAGVRLLISAESFKTSDYRSHGPVRRRAECPHLERVVFLDTDDWSDAGRGGGTSVAEGAVAEHPGDARAERPDQHPVHLRHHRAPQGRDAEPPQHPQQRLPHTELIDLTPTTGCASRCRSTTASGW
jgi:fatty-acyl-CoA synthase